MTKIENYALILASGGLDSTACINFYKNLKFEVEVLFIDYRQIASKKELAAIISISKYYQVNLITIKINNGIAYGGGLINGRNAFLCFTALMNFKKENGVIALGIHAGTKYYDCSAQFSTDVQNIFDKYSFETIKLGTPFINFSKTEIYDYCENEKVPVNLTYSCEIGGKQPCGKCSTCKDLIAIYARKKF